MPSRKHRVHSVSGRHKGKTPSPFRQRSSQWRPLTECIRRFPESIRNFFQLSDIYRVDTKIAEAHANIARSFLKSLIPLLKFTCGEVYGGHFNGQSNSKATWAIDFIFKLGGDFDRNFPLFVKILKTLKYLNLRADIFVENKLRIHISPGKLF